VAQIQFTDSVGAATLRNGHPAPGDRFAGWTPVHNPIADAVVALGTRATHSFRFATEYGALFRLEHLPMRQTSGVYYVEIAARLVAHLVDGGTCSVQPEDGSGTVYATCGLLPGTRPELAMSDRGPLLYTLSLAVVNLAGAPMVCRYAS
jgi:hypothetical protein